MQGKNEGGDGRLERKEEKEGKGEAGNKFRKEESATGES